MQRITPSAALVVAALLGAGLVIYIFGPATVAHALLWAMLGAIVGWVGSLIMRPGTQQGIVFDILAGAFGAVLGLSLFGISQGGPFERALASILGAAVVVCLWGASRRMRR